MNYYPSLERNENDYLGKSLRNNSKANLSKLHSVHAKKLIQDLEVENKEIHREKAIAYLIEKQKEWLKQENILKELIMLNQLRTSVFEDDISKNPKGQILEPGFRVIFSEMK